MSEHNLGQPDSLLRDGEMKRLELDGKAVLLTCVDGAYYAVGGNCSHYGAPLDKGVLKGNTVICPWHHACFDVTRGTRLEPPALNDLPSYPVRVENGNLVLTLPDGKPASQPQPDAAADSRTFVIIGGGAAGQIAAEELRRAGFAGKVILVSASSHVPVDRPNLSKDYLDGHAPADWLPLRGEGWFASHNIDLRLNTRVTRISPDAHTIDLENGGAITYDKLLLATGGIPRQLRDVPDDLQGVYTLRSLSDAERIIEAAVEKKRAVVVGASFIGMEVAAALAGGRDVTVTVVAPEAVPFEKILGVDIGALLQREHEAHGVRFCLGTGVKRILSENGSVSGVELETGEVVPADFVVVGIGVRPATDFLEGSQILRNERDGSVLVDAALQTSHPDIYAAGDIARWTDDDGTSTRIEHWRVAQQHGVVAARNMLGGSESVTRRVPFFWTAQWDITLRYAGHAEKWDDIVFRGDVNGEDGFIGFYVQNGRVKAAISRKRDAELDAVEFIMRDDVPLTVPQIEDETFDLIAYARQGTQASTEEIAS